MKLKDFLSVLNEEYELSMLLDGEKLFECKSNSKALNNYADNLIDEIRIRSAMMNSCGYIIIYLKGLDNA